MRWRPARSPGARQGDKDVFERRRRDANVVAVEFRSCRAEVGVHQGADGLAKDRRLVDAATMAVRGRVATLAPPISRRCVPSA